MAYCESDMGIELLTPVLNRLIPVLMKNMVSGFSPVLHWTTVYCRYSTVADMTESLLLIPNSLLTPEKLVPSGWMLLGSDMILPSC